MSINSFGHLFRLTTWGESHGPAIGCVVAGASIQAGSFAGFCLAAFLMGANNAVVMQYRFAAVEYVESPRASRAISVVMSGALAAAWLGPEIAVRAAQLVAGAEYAGSFYAGTALYLVAALMLARLAPSTVPLHFPTESPRPLAEIAAQPDFRVAVLAALFQPVAPAKMVGQGDADFGMSMAPSIVFHQDAGLPIMTLAGVHPGCWELFAQPSVRTIGDLKGKTVDVPDGLGSSAHLYLAAPPARR